MHNFKSRRNFLQLSASAIAATLIFNNNAQAKSNNSAKIPVIMDTDIGDDIDDAWALALLLKSPELDLKMLLTDTGNPQYRGAVAGKYLEAAKRTDIPIGLGIQEHDGTGAQQTWLGDYKILDYPGQVYDNGVGKMIELIMNSPEPITIICTGPVPNIKAALEIEPRIVENTRIVAMLGSLRYGYNRTGGVDKETNVRLNPEACRKMLQAFPDITITPLDTCAMVKFQGEKYQQVRNSQNPLIKMLIESYDSWSQHVEWLEVDSNVTTSTLYDTVAVYLALSEKYLEIEKLGVRVTDDGYTMIDNKEKSIRAATNWEDLSAFKDWLVNRLLSDLA